MPRSHISYSDDSDDYGNPITISKTQTRIGRAPSHSRGRQPSTEIVQNIMDPVYLVPDRGRHRASSTSGRAQPVINIINDVERSPSRSRSRRRRSSSSERDHHWHHRPSRGENDLDYETRRRLEKLRLLEEEEAADKARDQARRDMDRAAMKKKIEEQEQKEHEKELRKRFLAEERIREAEEKQKEKDAKEKYIADYKREQAEKEEKKKKQKEEDDRKFEQRFREEFLAAGYSIESVESMLRKRREKEKREDSSSLAIDLSRPTYIKVHRKYLHTETLDYFDLPWEWDSDQEYIIIKRYISHTEQERLFEHTRTLRERKLIAGPVVKETKLTINDGLGRSEDGLYVVRRKSVSRTRKDPRRNSWLFT